MEVIHALTDKAAIVTLAILGAIIATAGGALDAKRTKPAARFGRMMMWIGYIISFASVALFIIAGFLSSR